MNEYELIEVEHAAAELNAYRLRLQLKRLTAEARNQMYPAKKRNREYTLSFVLDALEVLIAERRAQERRKAA